MKIPRGSAPVDQLQLIVNHMSVRDGKMHVLSYLLVNAPMGAWSITELLLTKQNVSLLK